MGKKEKWISRGSRKRYVKAEKKIKNRKVTKNIELRNITKRKIGWYGEDVPKGKFEYRAHIYLVDKNFSRKIEIERGNYKNLNEFIKDIKRSYGTIVPRSYKYL